MSKRRKIRPHTPPRWSAHLYVRVKPSDVHLFRFYLEAYDNLAYFSVLEKYRCLMKLVFAPGQEREVREALEGIQSEIDITIIDPPMSNEGLKAS